MSGQTKKNESSSPSSKHVPALGFRFLTPLYDGVMALTMRETTFRRRLIDQLGLQPGMTVVDLGSGTGSLALLMKSSCPEVRVIGVDADPQVIHIAKAKSERQGADIEFVESFAEAAPIEAATADRVTSTLLLHHLDRSTKLATLEKARSMLKSDGEFHLVDWTKPRGLFTAVGFSLVRLLDGFEPTRANARGELELLMAEAGFEHVERMGTLNTVFGTLGFNRARVQGSPE